MLLNTEDARCRSSRFLRSFTSSQSADALFFLVSRYFIAGISYKKRTANTILLFYCAFLSRAFADCLFAFVA